MHDVRCMERMHIDAMDEICESLQVLNDLSKANFGYPDIPRDLFHIPGTLPDRIGVYFVWMGLEIVYVGQSTCLQKRVTHSHAKIFHGDKVTFVEFPASELCYAECYYIGVCRPRRNFEYEPDETEVRRETDRCTKEKAISFLHHELSNGPVASKDLVERANAQGVTDSTIRRVEKLVGLKRFQSRRNGMRQWYAWIPPTNHEVHDE